MIQVGKALLVIGLTVGALGAVLWFAGRMGLPLGRLPGDFAFRGKHVSVFFPLGTCILISVMLSLILYFVSRFHR